jgi:peptide deformylase
MKEIVQKDNKVLRKISKEIPVKDIKSKKIQNLLKELHETLAGEKDGVALSAPQIAESLRVFIISPIAYSYEEFKDLEKRTVFINPKIIKKSKDAKKMDEGCLSVRGWYGKVKRASRATVEAYDASGEKFTAEGRGLMAQIFQHEIDHLDGILFIDKAEDLKEIDLEKYDSEDEQ